MIWAGSPFAQRIEFSTGLPTGAVSFQLLDAVGTVLLSDTVTPDAGAMDCLILIDGANNTTAKPLFDTRTLAWHFLTASGLVSDRVTYTVRKPIPFAATVDGVRVKLGVEDHEITADDVDLVSAYAEFTAMFEDGALTAHVGAGDRNELMCIHAIEALASLALLPSLQIKLAQRETSGTNEFSRYSKIDWALIEADLIDHVARARQMVTGETGGTVSIFTTIGIAVDPITGASN